ncbi:BlaI/MecI/CopY family transcriptional regulator [Streptomyces albicerus]|uniref:BlaI/MecI/CopY family transcriptional regulator n=1 Tax=Streptomyces albicerus TaxID=2569859 RepID=UPI00124B5862|nr:BlaI/MecI/CopY family transcriptional regulator [Streptomyces albicerus]
MPEGQIRTTELTSQYVAQVTGDLERNAKEMDRINAEVEALQQQLQALQHDHTVLVNMQQALGGAGEAGAEPAAPSVTTAAPSVPQQTSAEPKQGKAKKAASEKTAAKAPSAKGAKTAAKPTLVDLLRGHLKQESEPRSAAEITSALAEAHPDRNIKTTVVRTTLEGLVAKSHAHRTKQGSSVFYSAAADAQPAQAKQQTEDTAR